MKEEYINLTYYQVMAFLLKINEFKENNPYFNDSFANSFSHYVLIRTFEIATKTPAIQLKLFPNLKKYKISKSLYNYLTNLTSINVFDKNTMMKYNVLIKEFENETEKQNVKKKIHKK